MKRIVFFLLATFLYEQTLPQMLIDIDGNQYPTFVIGTQVWMAENLRVTRTPDGSSVQSWAPLDDESLTGRLGRMYNWETAGKVCPEGWHLPADEEWVKMIDFLGGYTVAGGKMKAEGTEYWKSPNKGATNESGFNALPVGYRTRKGKYINFQGAFAYYWTSSGADESTAWGIYLTYGEPIVYRYSYSFTKPMGFSVRCVKD